MNYFNQGIYSTILRSCKAGIFRFIKENKKVKKERKHAINQESDQEVKKKTKTTKKKEGNGKRKLELNI